MTALASDLRSRLLTTRLPALPQVLMKVMQTCADEDSGMNALAELIMQDPALSAKVLQVATSPAYHYGSHPASIERALTTIGIDMVRTLLVTQSVYQTFHDIGAGLDLRGFWIHTITTGVTASMLAKRQNYPQPEEAYLAGLLHDIGRLALVTVAPDTYTANFFDAEDPGLCALEERTLEITHAEAGALLIERLPLDSFLADAVRYHHTPVERLQHAHPLVRIVANADRLVQLKDTESPTSAQVLEAAGLTENEYLSHQGALARQVQQLAAALGITLPAPAPAKAAAHAIAAAAIPVRRGDVLKDSMRDLILVEKTLAALRQQTDAEGCVRAIVKAAVILFDFIDAVVLVRSNDGVMLTPKILTPGRQRLAGLALPAGDDNLAGRVARSGQPGILTAPAGSVAEEQLLRFFGSEALVALRVVGARGEPLVVLGATSAAQARHLAERLALLREFGGQAGALLEGVGGADGESRGPAAARNDDLQLAARQVAHEVSNPLAIIRNYLTVLQRKADSDQPIDSELQTIEEELDRVARIVHDFAQPGSVAPGEAVCDVNAALKYVTRLFTESATLPGGVQIARHVSSEPTLAAIDEGSLRQVLINLVKNAIEAMPNGGRIDARNNGIIERDGLHYISVTVSDTGPGIPDTVRARLFQPGPSTKEGPNRGLGLSIVHDLVQRHGGQIACRSNRGGTSFDISLPAVRLPATPRQAAA